MTILELKEELEKLIQIMGSGQTEVMVSTGTDFVSMSVVGAMRMRVVRPVFGSFKYWNTSYVPSPGTKIVLCLGIKEDEP